jgi:5-methylcytosine-specific restriction protein A
MSARAVQEWIGATPETAVPARVQLRVLDRTSGHCALCGRGIGRLCKPHFDHVTALINGGENRESNLQVLCGGCHSVKTKADVREKSAVAKKRKKLLGIKRQTGRPLPGTRASGIRKRMNGRVEPWPA